MTDNEYFSRATLIYDDVLSVSPALESFTKVALRTDLWNRIELSRRDRCLATVACLIARMQIIEMPFYFALALDSGVTAAELSEIITHAPSLHRDSSRKSPIISAAPWTMGLPPPKPVSS